MIRRLHSGLVLAALMFVYNVIIVAGSSYIVACLNYEGVVCSIDTGFRWVSAHPVFPKVIPAFSVIAFFVGFIGDFPRLIQNRLARILPWIVLIFLLTAFMLWGF